MHERASFLVANDYEAITLEIRVEVLAGAASERAGHELVMMGSDTNR